MTGQAVIISTGDELTTGSVVDANSAALAEQLSTLGIDITAILTVGDNGTRLHWALCQAHDLSDLILGTGGLGPKANDLAAEVVAKFLGRRLLRNESMAHSLAHPLEDPDLGGSLTDLKHARFPEGSVIIPNLVGTVAGFRVSLEPNKSLIWLPGVPREMITMLRATVIPWILEQEPRRQRISACRFKIHGLTQPRLDELLKSLSLPQGAKLSWRADFPDLLLRLTVSDKEERVGVFALLKSQIEERLAPHIYAEGEKTLEEVVGEILLRKNETLALAESCTGGYISHRITRVAGSSVYYYGGAVTYSNEAKMLYLGVKPQTLQEHGAVSRETALEMSAGVRDRLGATIGVGVTGIAGPSGGTTEKPVGTVWISIARRDLHEARLFRFDGDRERIILGTSQAALDWLRISLSEQ